MTRFVNSGDCAAIKVFAGLVKQQRDAQKAYFKSRGTRRLAEAKRLEREVDEAVRKILSPPQQENLL